MDWNTCEEKLQFWTEILNLDGWEVVSARYDPEEMIRRLTVIPPTAVGVCPDCGNVTHCVHQKRDRDHIRDLPIANTPVELRVRCFQFQCNCCKRCFTPQCPFLAEGAHATERFLERCAQLIRVSDISNAAAFFGMPETTLGRWYYAYVERRQQQAEQPQTPIRSIGIDELSLKKSTMSSR